MPIMVIYRAENIAREAYAPYEAEIQTHAIPVTALMHQIGFSGGSFCSVDVWESRADFEAFTDSDIKPTLAKHGLPYPEPEIFEITALSLYNDIERYRVA